MKTVTLKKRILTAFTGIIVLMSVCILALGVYVLKKEIFTRTQQQVNRSLDSARLFYSEEISRIGDFLNAADLKNSPDKLKQTLRLDYFYRIPLDEALTAQSDIVRKAAADNIPAGGTRIITTDELQAMDPAVRERARIRIQDTPKAGPTTLTRLDSAMAKEYALPMKDETGKVTEIIYGGRVINQDNVFVDRIRKMVFGDELYKDKPIGTVTIFQNDVRISTNVLDTDGQRAIGTRVSQEVYQEVVQKGSRWLDRAFVVTHWYKTAYEPIRNIDGDVIGILYVGILEEQFTDMWVKIFLVFMMIILLASAFAFLLSLVLTRSIVRPITVMRDATQRLSGGELGHVILESQASIEEMQQLALAFNEMSVRLEEREIRLEENRQKLAAMNKSYLDLLGFVAHELKGMLSSAVINAYSLRDGLLGMINFKQKKAVDSICRNLDYLDATVKKFLNLSRIERGNMEINKIQFNLKNDVFDISIQTFTQLQATKKMQIDNQIDPNLTVFADIDLMQIVANNLVNNAIKYGTHGGSVRLTSRDKGGFVTVEVYNDSRPISEEMIGMLFKKFSRLDVPEKKQVKGTGLGLYITKQIVEAHGGTINVEPRENGNAFILTIHKE